MVSFRDIAEKLSHDVVAALHPAGTAAASCHQSDAAYSLIASGNITVREWNDYPEPPESFLAHEWNEEHFAQLKVCLACVTENSPCSLSEFSCAMRILSPLLDAFVQTLPKVVGINLKEQNVLHKAQERNGSNTIADFSTWKAVRVNNGKGRTTWDKIHPALSFAELKPPKAAYSNGMQGGLSALYNTQLVIQPNDNSPSNVKLIGQIVELCHQSSLGFGWLAACPLNLRPIYLHLAEDNRTGQAFLANNIMGGAVAEEHIFEKDRWACFFGKVFWITFCVWLKGLDEAIEVLEKLPEWKVWAPIVERTLRPVQSQQSSVDWSM